MAALLNAGTFHLLNHSAELGRPPRDWHLGNPTSDRLWLVTLHGHPWAYAAALVAHHESGAPETVRREAAAVFGELVGDWIKRCGLEEPGSRFLAWNSYAIATRVRWWIASYVLAADALFEDAAFERAFIASLWEQARFLHRHVEWDLRGNHLLRDASGLALVGAFFDGDASARWLARAESIALSQVEEQVLDDGGHFERSARYHIEAMEDLAIVCLLTSDETTRHRLRDAWRRMAEFLPWICHPSGKAHQMNDSCADATLAGARLLETAPALGVELRRERPRGGRLLADTGLAVWHGSPWTAFFDVGPHGPAEQPGHAHADTLTLEVSYDGRPLFVDPGTYGYDLDDRRRYDRSTGSHNTVCVDGLDSSEVWHIFRAGRRAARRLEQFLGNESRLLVRASHDGYRYLSGRPFHERRVTVGERAPLIVEDIVGGGGDHAVTGGFLLDPQWVVEAVENGWLLRSADAECALRVTVKSTAALNLSSEPRPYHPDYGIEGNTARLLWSWSGSLPISVTIAVSEVS